MAFFHPILSEDYEIHQLFYYKSFLALPNSIYLATQKEFHHQYNELHYQSSHNKSYPHLWRWWIPFYHANDILLTTVATLGRSCIYNGVPENLCFQRSVTVITTNILPQYLKIFFDAPYFQDFIINNATGTAQKGFYLNQLEGVLVCVPPVEEQERLSAKIQQLLSSIQHIEKSLSNIVVKCL